jgi:hypothetical protein
LVRSELRHKLPSPPPLPPSLPPSAPTFGETPAPTLVQEARWRELRDEGFLFLFPVSIQRCVQNLREGGREGGREGINSAVLRVDKSWGSGGGK